MAFVEKYYPIFFTLMCTVLVYKYSSYISKFDTLIPLLTQSSLTISATLLGFLLTILTIINTINTRRMQFVKDAGKYPTLMSFLSAAIVSNIIVVLFSFVQLFLNRTEINTLAMKLIDYGFIFISLFALLVTTRFAIIFIQLLADKKQLT